MKHLIAVLYISFGLLIVTLTFFSNYSGPEFLTFIGFLLVIVGMIFPYYTEITNFLKVDSEGEKKDI